LDPGYKGHGNDSIFLFFFLNSSPFGLSFWLIRVLGGGEDGLVEEVFREEIRVSEERMPGFGYAPESD